VTEGPSVSCSLKRGIERVTVVCKGKKSRLREQAGQPCGETEQKCFAQDGEADIWVRTNPVYQRLVKWFLLIISWPVKLRSNVFPLAPCNPGCIVCQKTI
jgi:hypothetical protein